MSIAFGGIVSLLFRGVNLVVALGLVALCAFELEKEDYGRFVLGLTFVGIVSAVTGGLTAATAYQVSNQRREPASALLNGGAISVLLGAIAVLAGLVAGSLLAGDARQEAAAVGLAAAAVTLNGVVSGVFLGRGTFVRYNLALICPPLLALAAIGFTFYVLGEKTTPAALWAYAAGWWAGVIGVAAGGGVRPSGSGRLEVAVVKQIAWFATLAGFSSGISYLNYRADLFVVGHFEGGEGVATYSLAVYVAEAVWQVSGSLALATFSRMAAVSRPEAAALAARVMRHTLLLLGAICTVLFVLSPLIESVVFSKYDGMGAALRFLLPGVVLYGLAQAFSGFYTYQRGMPWMAAIVAGSGLALDMFFALLLIPPMGVNGAALASALAYSLAVLGGLTVFARSEGLAPAQLLRFGTAEWQDYRGLLQRLRAGIARG